MTNFPDRKKDGNNDEFEVYLRESMREVKNSAHDIGQDRRLREKKQRQWFGVTFKSKKESSTIQPIKVGNNKKKRETDELGSLELTLQKSDSTRCKKDKIQQESIMKIRE